MSKKEIDQVWIMEMLKKEAMLKQEAAKICNLSPKQIGRKYKRFLNEGAKGLIHKSRGKPSNRQIKPEVIEEILVLLKTIYYDFGPTLASEKLLENHNIKVDHETLRRIMIKYNLHITKNKKTIKHMRREPKHHKGELVQLDGSEHVWFGDTKSTLIVFIDDATKEVFCRFAPESTKGVTNTFDIYLKRYGRPIAIYTDNGKVFKVNNSKAGKKRATQFARMLSELNIKGEFASTPQAKVRVERVNRTLQDRLVKELRLLNINTIEEANAILDNFLEKFNQKFCVKPKKSESFFRNIEGFNLKYILCYKYNRILNNDATISYKNRCFQLQKQQQVKLYSKDKVDVYVAFDGTISLWKNGIKLNFKEIEIPVKQKSKVVEKIDRRVYPRKPKPNHPWTGGCSQTQQQQEDISNESETRHF